MITAFTAVNRGLPKFVTSLPCATLARVPEDLRHRKMRLDEVKRLQLPGAGT